MASTWTAELSFDGFTYTPTPDPGGFGDRAGWWWVGLEAICLPLLDPLPQFNTALDDGNFCLLTGYADGSTDAVPSPGAFQLVTFRLNSPEIMPPQWTQIFILLVIAGEDPALLASGGTLSITKDYDGDLMTFTGPLGTQTCSLTGIDALPGGPYGYHNTTPLRPRGYAHRVLFPDPTFADPAYDIHDTVSWYNLTGKENGTPYMSVALSSGDPGTWWPINSRAFIPSVGTVDPGLSPWWTFSQLASRQKVAVDVLAASYPDWRGFIAWKRLRAGVETSIAMEFSPEHGILWRGGPDLSLSSKVDVQRSFDNARNWDAAVTAFSGGGTTNQSPSLNFAHEVLYLCWHNGTSIIESHSRDLGATWQVPTTIPFTGTNPRRLQSRHGGPAYYFYIDGSGDLQVVRSSDNAATFDGPYAIVAGIGAQQVDAEFDNEGAIIVSYIDSTPAWVQKRSRDHGVTWS